MCDDEREAPQNDGQSLNLNVSHYFLFFLLILVLFACYKILQPYLNTIILATILAIAFSPIHRRIERLVRGRKNLAALLSCLVLTLVVIIPLSIMVIAVIQQGIESFNNMYDWISSGEYKKILDSPIIKNSLTWIEAKLPDIQKFFPDLELQKLQLDKMLLSITASVGKFLVNQGGHVVGNITALFAKFILMIFVFFFIIRDESKIFESILHYSPLSASNEERIIKKVRDVSRSALIGTFVTALAQGAAGGFAFWICGLPGLFWGMVIAFASLIPVVGTALIWFPAAVYLLLTGHWGLAIFMVLWCAIVVGLIDNLVRPLFMTGSAGMNTLIIFFSILGGISYFGLIGVLYGPLIFGLAMILFYIYRIQFAQFLEAQDTQ